MGVSLYDYIYFWMAFKEDILSLTPKERRYIKGAVYQFIYDELDVFYSELTDADVSPFNDKKTRPHVEGIATFVVGSCNVQA